MDPLLPPEEHQLWIKQALVTSSSRPRALPLWASLPSSVQRRAVHTGLLGCWSHPKASIPAHCASPAPRASVSPAPGHIPAAVEATGRCMETPTRPCPQPTACPGRPAQLCGQLFNNWPYPTQPTNQQALGLKCSPQPGRPCRQVHPSAIPGSLPDLPGC